MTFILIILSLSTGLKTLTLTFPEEIPDHVVFLSLLEISRLENLRLIRSEISDKPHEF